MRHLCVLRQPLVALAVLGFALAGQGARGADAPASKPAAPAPAVATGSEPVARLGDTVITRTELDDASRNMFEMYKQRMAAAGQPLQGADANREPTDDQKRKVLESLINSRILESLIKKADTKATDAELADRMKIVMDSQGVKSEEELGKLFQQRGGSLDQFKAQVKDLVVRQKYVENLTKDVTATDADIEATYNKLKADGQMELKEESLDVAAILIRVNSNADDVWVEAKKKIDAIRERIVKNKEDFSKVAVETSQDPEAKKNGGVYSLVTQKAGPFGSEFTAAAFALPDGEISKPIRTKVGWCILKVVGKRAPGPLALSDSGVKLFVTLRSAAQKSKELLDKTVADARAAMKVEILLPAVTAAPVLPPAAATPPAGQPATPKSDPAPNSLLVPGST